MEEGFSAIYISTHSLTRRLTACVVSDCDASVISTHSLTRRLTIAEKLTSPFIIFQLTASQGG